MSARHEAAGCTLTSMTPGSGVTFSTCVRASRGGVYPSTATGCFVATAVSSMAASSARYASSRSIGGMKTYRWPSRTCRVIAVLITSRGLSPRTPPSFARMSPRFGSASRGANGSTANSGSCSSGRTSGSEPSGNLNPSGESPPTAKRCPRRNGQGLDSQPTRPCFVSTARSGSTKPAGAPTPARSRRASRARSPGSARSACIGSALTGSSASASISRGTSSYAVSSIDDGNPSASVSFSPYALAFASVVRPGLVVSAMRSSCCHIGSPSVRQMIPSAQRGSGSPGYHLPCPK